MLKKIVELLLCIAAPGRRVLIWISLIFGKDHGGIIARLAWGVAVLVPFVPFLYVLTGNDFL